MKYSMGADENKKTKKIERPHLATAQEQHEMHSNPRVRTREEKMAQIQALREAREGSYSITKR